MSLPHKVLIVGAGKIGRTIYRMLCNNATFSYVTIADQEQSALDGFNQTSEHRSIWINDSEMLQELVNLHTIVVSAGPYFINAGIAELALQAGASYFDLTEDVKTTETIRNYAASAAIGQVFMPQCGLAPGMIGILANDIAHEFDTIQDINMRVGALPKQSNNALKYSLTWSTEGLINEYCNPCDILREGKITVAEPLEGCERITIDGVEYEAFNTSGGLGTLCETWQNRVQSLSYKTIRYPGHRDLMKFLLTDLKLNKQKDLLKDILDGALPHTTDDVVLVYASVKGTKDRKPFEKTKVLKFYGGQTYLLPEASAIQLTTAGSMCAVLELYRDGRLPVKGFVRQEDVSWKDYVSTIAGKVMGLFPCNK